MTTRLKPGTTLDYARQLQAAGFTIWVAKSQPQPDWFLYERKGSVDYTIEIAEQRDHDGADADPGINFGLSVVEWGGPIRGEFALFNFTPQVWVDAYDDEAVESRWQAFAEVDVESAAKLATKKGDAS